MFYSFYALDLCEMYSKSVLSVLQCVSMGVLLGAGRQRIAAVANLFGYYCIGLPVGIALMFSAGLQVTGLFSLYYSF